LMVIPSSSAGEPGRVAMTPGQGSRQAAATPAATVEQRGFPPIFRAV
jgi:hypothetical protein